ncbi:glycosyltransferase [Scopulibacillus cellulosilyticus]|uniref:Glycosyltransferase n=1 Tax=Scopulibacillus cellulosilyticus TaxID=2665665 RepID=A0ABW2PYE5_9BACL
MATISLCMIVKNEEAVLSRCLESVKELVDEIIIVDTGSTDETKEIARETAFMILNGLMISPQPVIMHLAKLRWTISSGSMPMMLF